MTGEPEQCCGDSVSKARTMLGARELGTAKPEHRCLAKLQALLPPTPD